MEVAKEAGICVECPFLIAELRATHEVRNYEVSGEAETLAALFHLNTIKYIKNAIKPRLAERNCPGARMDSTTNKVPAGLAAFLELHPEDEAMVTSIVESSTCPINAEHITEMRQKFTEEGEE
jgi:hypothetical protein